MSIPINISELRSQLSQSYTELTPMGIELMISSIVGFSDDANMIEFFDWLNKLNSEVTFETEIVSLSDMQKWGFDPKGNIRHETGKFFSIEGLKLKSNFNDVIKEWDQPIINQPEVGFLGIICQIKNNVLHFLMQGKIEPGNVNKIQISPTLQATKSNFSQVHGGNTPKFLDYFKNDISEREVIVDQLQSEQGARFLRKRNRNMIIKMTDDFNVIVPDNFFWLTLGQLKKAMMYPNLVNMDTRTVLSCIQIL